MGTNGGRQADGLERGYKCFADKCFSACRYRGFHHLTNTSMSLGACLLTHHSILPRPYFICISINPTPDKFLYMLNNLPYIEVAVISCHSTPQNHRHPALFASHLAPQTLSLASPSRLCAPEGWDGSARSHSTQSSANSHSRPATNNEVLYDGVQPQTGSNLSKCTHYSTMV
jgi:hypothetical protein